MSDIAHLILLPRYRIYRRTIQYHNSGSPWLIHQIFFILIAPGLLQGVEVPEIAYYSQSGSPHYIMEVREAVAAIAKGIFGCKSTPYHICSIHAPFSVVHIVISGGYYCSPFESVIKLIVQ